MGDRHRPAFRQTLFNDFPRKIEEPTKRLAQSRFDVAARCAPLHHLNGGIPESQHKGQARVVYAGAEQGVPLDAPAQLVFVNRGHPSPPHSIIRGRLAVPAMPVETAIAVAPAPRLNTTTGQRVGQELSEG